MKVALRVKRIYKHYGIPDYGHTLLSLPVSLGVVIRLVLHVEHENYFH